MIKGLYNRVLGFERCFAVSRLLNDDANCIGEEV